MTEKEESLPSKELKPREQIDAIVSEREAAQNEQRTAAKTEQKIGPKVSHFSEARSFCWILGSCKAPAISAINRQALSKVMNRSVQKFRVLGANPPPAK